MINYNLTQSILNLKSIVENLRATFTKKYSKNLVEAALYNRVQIHLEREPLLMLPSDEAFAFYEALINKSYFESIICEHFRSILLKRIIAMNLKDAESNFMLNKILDMRPPYLKQYLSPEKLVTLCPNQNPNKNHIKQVDQKSKKRVRFKME